MKNPFDNEGDAHRSLAQDPAGKGDSARLRRFLATRPDFIDLSRMSDAQVRAYVATLKATGRLPSEAGKIGTVKKAGAATVIPAPAEVPVVPTPLKKSEPPKEEQKFKLVSVKPLAARDQFVNIDPSASDIAIGRSIEVTARLDQKQSGVTVYFGIESGNDNRAGLPNELQASIVKKATTNADGMAKVKLTLSRFGGDKFKALASLQEKIDPAGGGTVKSEEITVWRRMSYQITADQGATLPSRSKTFAAFKKTFLGIQEVNTNIIKYSDIAGLAYHPFWQFRPDLSASADGDRNVVCIGDHNKGKFYKLFKKPAEIPTAHLIMCDAQWDPITGPASSYSLEAVNTVLVQENDAKNDVLGVFKPTLDGSKLVRSGSWSWNDGAVVHNGIFTDADVSVEKARNKAADHQVTMPTQCVAGTCKGCPGGTHIIPSAAKPALAELRLRCASGPWAGESGQPGRPQCLIVVDSNENQFNNTIAHEIGHLFKQVRKEKAWLGIPDHLDQYEKRGGQGSHCKKDATESAVDTDQDKKPVYEGGTCIMYHVAVGNTDFCEKCALDLRIRDMSDFFK